MKQNAFVIWLAVVVVLGGVLGGAFAGGIAIGKSQGREQATQELQSQRSQLAAGLGQRGTQQGTPQPGQGTPQPGSSFPGGLGGFAGRGGTVGAVEKIEGNVVTLNTPQGAVRVMVDGSTSIQKMGAGSLGDISAGESITVSGERQADGSIQATGILITPVLGSQ
ncbi:MAG: hypothetical protein KJ624_07075 [Chloroflexi bacterium]|nr:hypothetical protein [Chloroflexota bacterium]